MRSKKEKWDSGDYDSKYDFVSRYGEELLSMLQAGKGERVLDLGCGTGDLTYLISLTAGEVIGLDKSIDMIHSARNKYPNLEFLQADAANFDFDLPFDAIFSNAALHWVLDYKSCIKSMFRNLKSGGRLVAEFGAENNIRTIVQALRSALLERGYSKQAQKVLWYFPSVEEYSETLESEGFNVIFANHFDRPTKLNADVGDWLRMFASPFFEGIPEVASGKVIEDVIQLTSRDCYRDGKWYADYKRLRIQAIREG